MSLLSRVSIASPIKRHLQDDEEHINSRLNHYIKRLHIIIKKADFEYANELNELRQRFEKSLTNDNHQQKQEFLEYYAHTLNGAVSDYLQNELDKQYLNEDICIEIWYMKEILPYLKDGLAMEISQIIAEYEIALKKDDFGEKFNAFTETVDNYSQNLTTYLDSEPQPLPVLNAHLKFFQYYVSHLLQNNQVLGAKVYEVKLRALLNQVEQAIASEHLEEKLQTIDAFDAVDTEFGQFLFDHMIDFEICRFGFEN
ncbi:hypothetical protein GQX74_014118 [Glossina fuscipes]|nr:hypothetical protein GQX74_014118 [Glossina fuscipes]